LKTTRIELPEPPPNEKYRADARFFSEKMQRILAHFHPFPALRRAPGVFFLKVFYENPIARKRQSGQTEKI
jgi:hypothetical protein